MDGSDEHGVELSGPIKVQLSRVLLFQGFYSMDLVITHYMNVKKCYYSVPNARGTVFCYERQIQVLIPDVGAVY
jgi:hypothetical protein